MLCFGRRKKCFEKDEDEGFTKLHEEPKMVQQKVKHSKNLSHNIAQHRVLVVNGKPLQVLQPNGLHEHHRHDQSRGHKAAPVIQSPTLHSQTLDYKHLHNRNNVYRPGKNTNVTVQRSASVNYPTQPQHTQVGHSRPHSQVFDRNYTQLEDVKHNWVVAKDTISRADNVSTGTHTSPSGNRGIKTSPSDNRGIKTSPRGNRDIKTSPSVNRGVKTSPSGNSRGDNDDLEKTLAHLDDTLNSFCIDGAESDSTDEETNKPQTTRRLEIPIEDGPSRTDSGIDSPTDSLGSNTSLHGIIANHDHKTGHKRTSVSFKLPADHVDKPYSPMQFTKPKSKSSSILTITSHNHSVPPSTLIPHHNKPPTICVWDAHNKVWHRTEGTVHGHSQENTSEYMYPFRGSFPNLFYGKYLNGEMKSSNTQCKPYLAPGILHKIESYESLTDVNAQPTRHQVEQDMRRHSVAYY